MDYDRTKTDGSSRFGALTEVGDTYQEMTVSDDKSFNGIIDKGNDTSQLMIKAASKVLKRQTDEVLIPYVDKYRLTKMANGAKTVTVNATALTKSTILEAIFKAGAAMSNLLVPLAGRVIYIGETMAVNMKLADQVVGLEKAGQAAVVNGVCGTIGGMQVRIVPDVYLPDNVSFMIIKKGVACAPKKIERCVSSTTSTSSMATSFRADSCTTASFSAHTATAFWFMLPQRRLPRPLPTLPAR